MEASPPPAPLSPLPALDLALEKQPSKDITQPLPTLTTLTGDEKLRKDAAQSKVATGDLPPIMPLPSLPDAAKPDLPALPPLSGTGNAQTAPIPATAPKETSVASLPSPAALQPASPAAGSANTADLRIIFNETETDVPLAITGKLDALAQRLSQDSTSRVTIMAYAGGPESSGIYPKRVSLARGIAVRNYLTTNKGIDIERVNVKALGNKNEGGPADRVDLFVLK